MEITIHFYTYNLYLPKIIVMDNLYEQALSSYKRHDKKQLDVISDRLKSTNIPFKRLSEEEYVSYPEYDDPAFNGIVTSKKEFHRNRYKKTTDPYDDVVANRCSSSKFDLSENQKFLKNFLSTNTPYSSMLLFHDVGTGKTCSAISIAEQLYGHFKKRALVIVSSNLKDNFKKQIFDISKVNIINGSFDEHSSKQCTGKTYMNLIPDKHTMNKDALDSKIKRVINERYQFKGYMEFANDYDKIKKQVDAMEKTEEKRKKRFDAKLKELFSNRVIIIDEVHNLRLASESSQKQVPPKVEHMLSVVENVKLVMLTATPMFNNVTEIVWLLNLMLIKDKRERLKMKDIFQNGKLTKDGKNKLIEASRGYVSHMSGQNPYTFPTKLYPSVNKDVNLFTADDKPKLDIFGAAITTPNTMQSLQLVKSYMSDYQQRVYELMQSRFDKSKPEVVDEIDEEDNPNDDAKTDIQMGIQISNIVYPSEAKNDDIKAYYGKLAFEKCFIKNSNKSNLMRISYDKQIVKKYGEFLAPDNIKQYSPKLHSILNYIKNSEGIVYVYSSFLYSGIIPLAIALEHMGFNKYGGHNILEGVKNIKPFKIGNKVAQYIVLSANSAISQNNDEEIRIAKEQANKEGEVIKVIIGSNVATEGIDFKRIREMHVLEPWYHLNKLEQIFGRGIRNCSHIDLPLEKRNVTIYQHVNTRDDATRETIDVRVYRLADGKQADISKIESILKKNAVDCFLNRHVLKFDAASVGKSVQMRTSQGVVTRHVLGSLEPQTNKCYGSWKEADPIETSTFNMSFVSDDVEQYIVYITQVFLKLDSPVMTYAQLKDAVSRFIEVEEDILKFTIHQMIARRVRVGQHYIIYNSNKYMLQREHLQKQRLTLEEHADPKYVQQRRRLDVKHFNLKNNDDDVDASGLVSAVHTAVEDVWQKVGKSKVYQSCAYDFVIDRMHPNDVMKIAEALLASKSLTTPDTIILDSIIASGQLLPPNRNTAKFFVTYNDEKNPYNMIDKNTSKFVKCPLIKRQEAETKELDMQTNVKNTFADVQAFIAPSMTKTVAHRFKIIAKTGTGSVCHANSKLKVQDLKDLINGIDDKLKLDKVSKGALCDVYELVLRKASAAHIPRPYQYLLLKDKKI
jgi:superfamily II DNA or RNA helicase